MRIAIFTNNYIPNPYGVTQSIESFRKQFEKRGHEVFIFAPRWKGYVDNNPRACPPSATPSGVSGRVFRYPSVDINIKFRFPLAIPYSRAMDKIIEKLDLDIIHSQHPNLLGTAAKKWARKKNIPLVFTWHTLYDRYTNFFPLVPQKWAANYIIKKAVNYANQCGQIIVPTESVKGIIREWGVTNENIEAIPSGIEEDMYANPDGAAIRQKYGIKRDEILLLLVSRLTEEKNVEFLFRALTPTLSRGEREVKMLVAGDGYLLPKLRQFAKDNNISDQIIFAGVVDKLVIKNYYAAADIFVYASKSETQGMIISEAMYCGLPVVALEATGIRDLVEDNINGFLIAEDSSGEFASAVNDLINNQEMRKKFGAASARRAREKYTDQVCADKMLEVYQRLIPLR